jgi:hypothetical protein
MLLLVESVPEKRLMSNIPEPPIGVGDNVGVGVSVGVIEGDGVGSSVNVGGMGGVTVGGIEVEAGVHPPANTVRRTSVTLSKLTFSCDVISF